MEAGATAARAAAWLWFAAVVALICADPISAFSHSHGLMQIVHMQPLKLTQGGPGTYHISHQAAKAPWRRCTHMPSNAPIDPEADRLLVGEDAAAFDLAAQSFKSWATFSVLVAMVLGGLYVVWLDEHLALGTKYLEALELIAQGNSHVTIILLLGVFGLTHSGLASLRPAAEEIIGARAWRVLFALVSLPLAFSSISFFINHRYDGIQLWDLRLTPGVHDAVWIMSFISFLFLYPSTFNLLEVAAVDKPKLHLWETGIIRITRHPQMVGQLLWCLAHSLWIGTSFTLTASAMLVGHHLFGVWNGDRRLSDKFGERFEAVRERTSVVPFQAIIEGRQKLPPNYISELIRPPYAIVIGGTLGAYFLHPFFQAGSWQLHW